MWLSSWLYWCYQHVHSQMATVYQTARAGWVKQLYTVDRALGSMARAVWRESYISVPVRPAPRPRSSTIALTPVWGVGWRKLTPAELHTHPHTHTHTTHTHSVIHTSHTPVSCPIGVGHAEWRKASRSYWEKQTTIPTSLHLPHLAYSLWTLHDIGFWIDCCDFMLDIN